MNKTKRSLNESIKIQKTLLLFLSVVIIGIIAFLIYQISTGQARDSSPILVVLISNSVIFSGLFSNYQKMKKERDSKEN